MIKEHGVKKNAMTQAQVPYIVILGQAASRPLKMRRPGRQNVSNSSPSSQI